VSETSRYVRTATRPLELALAIRSGMQVVHLNGSQSHADAETLQRNFAGTVPVILDQVSDWWDSVGNTQWPDDRLEPLGRLPWPRVWAEWRERSRGDQMMGLLMAEEPRERVLTQKAGFEVEAARTIGGDYVITMQWFSCPQGADRIVVAPPISYCAWKSGESVKKPNGTTPFVTVREAWPTPEADIWQTFSVWRLFTALLCVRGTVIQDAAIPRTSRRQFARINDGNPPWVTYKTLSVDLKLPSDASEGVRTADASSNTPRGVPLHLVRAHIADYRHGKGLFGKYKGLVWKAAHRRGYQRLGVVAKTYEAAIPEHERQNGDALSCLTEALSNAPTGFK